MDTGYTNAGEALPGLTATELVFRRLLGAIATGGLPPDTTFAEEQRATPSAARRCATRCGGWRR